jgi:hypothetical protein
MSKEIKLSQVILNEIQEITYEIEDLRTDMNDVDCNDPHTQLMIAQSIADYSSQLKVLNRILNKVERAGGAE